MELTDFFARAWNGYLQLTPDALMITDLLAARGERAQNDHIAFRTFNLPGIGRLELGKVFEEWGYVRSPEDLEFPEKKLMASYYLHPDPSLPKIFISELILEKCSGALQEWIRNTAGSGTPMKAKGAEVFLSPSWGRVDYLEYQKFYAESEYAAWTAAFGIQVNHFTVLVNSLKTFSSLHELNEFLQANGIKLNSAGGVIKGTPEELLEQSSTQARKIPRQFSGGVSQPVLGCYYEFARRYMMPGSDRLFSGFIPKSADKIFESTFERKSYP